MIIEMLDKAISSRKCLGIHPPKIIQFKDKKRKKSRILGSRCIYNYLVARMLITTMFETLIYEKTYSQLQSSLKSDLIHMKILCPYGGNSHKQNNQNLLIFSI